jgi:hypothetical protein
MAMLIEWQNLLEICFLELARKPSFGMPGKASYGEVLLVSCSVTLMKYLKRLNL